MPYADATKRRTYHAEYMQQWRARKAQQTPPPVPGSPQLEASAFADVAQRVQAMAHRVYQQSRELRSTHDAKVLQVIEELSLVHLEITDLLVQLTAGSAPNR